MKRHAYVVAAYGESPHLEECLESLVPQEGSEVLVSTSTPFEGLEAVAGRYGAKVVVHGPNAGIGQDWNAAYAAANADLVTIAHQDDLYEHGHGAVVQAAFRRYPDALLIFTDYREVAAGAVRPINRTLMIKRVMRELGFWGRTAVRAPLLKRLLLCFGNPIACPSVTINKERLAGFRFRTDMRTNMDWAAWAELAGKDGEFVYIRRVLMKHRIHPDSETTACIVDGARRREDEEMFRAFWPRPVARVLARLYAAGYGTNSQTQQ